MLPGLADAVMKSCREVAMSWSLAFLEREGVVVLVNEGELRADDLRRQTDEALVWLKRHGVFLCLVDCRSAVVELPASEALALLRYYDERGGNRRYRFAVLLPESERGLDVFRLYETAGHNRGYRVRLFHESAPALDWLESVRPAATVSGLQR